MPAAAVAETDTTTNTANTASTANTANTPPARGRRASTRAARPARSARPATGRPCTLWAVSDLHVHSQGNADIVDKYLCPPNPDDWLIVAGDVAEDIDTVVRTLAKLQQRYAHVIYTPGNHEIYARSDDRLKGRAKYDALIHAVQRLGVTTPEDPYVTFGDHTIVPLFTLYDHSWRAEGTTRDEALAAAQESGVVLTDSFTVEPYVDVELWCRDRLKYSVRRLASVSTPTILVNHWPLARETLKNVRYPEIGLWSGTRHTQNWPLRYRASTVIYGHLHIPVEIFVKNVTHAEVSLGYPREWKKSLPPRVDKKLWPYPVLTRTHDQHRPTNLTHSANSASPTDTASTTSTDKEVTP